MEGINAIAVIDKPSGMTSHDVVSRVRRILGTRKVGHTGTLDPEATGVLPICIGRATKVSDMLMLSDKEYIAAVRLGTVTDTQDIFGTVLEKRPTDGFSNEKLAEAVTRFTGEIDQVPPMYSAIKIGGKKLCDLARQGVEVERKARRVNIYSIETSDVTNDGFTMKVACSKGTYIRTLCHDIGEYLGCGACMASLRRTKSSVFGIDEAITLEELETAVSGGSLSLVLRPIDSVFAHLPRLAVNDEIDTRLRNGAPSTVAAQCGEYRVYNARGEFVAVGAVERMNGRNKVSVVKYFGV